MVEAGRPLVVLGDGWQGEQRCIQALCGLTRDELRYVLDPVDTHGEDYPGETFRVLKETEIRCLGEYRTRRLVLEAWDRQGVG